MNAVGEHRTDDMESLCARLDQILSEKHILPEDTDARLDVLRPLERAVMSLPEVPRLPDTPAGHLGRLLWFKQHPQNADLDLALDLIGNDEPLVRMVTVEVVVATLEVNGRWSEPGFSASARQILQAAHERETSPVIAYQLRRLLGQLPKAGRPRRRPALKVVTNPYLAGLPISRRQNFFGRQQVLNDIAYTLKTGTEVKSVVLYGARRTGKTSVLYRLRDGALGDEFLPVYLDMQSLAGTTLSDFLRALITETTEVVRDRVPEVLAGVDESLAEEVQFPALQRFFNVVLSRLDGISIVLLLDEYEVLEQFLNDANLGRQLQYLLNHEERLFIVFAGSQKLEALKNRNFLFLLDIAKDFRISFLKPDEAIALITEPVAGRLNFSSTAIDRILKLTAGHPFYTQLLCQIIFDHVDGSGTVESNDVEAAVRQFIDNPAPHLILTWNGLSIEQRVVASAAAQDDFESPRTTDGIVTVLKRERYPLAMRPGEVEQEFRVLTQIDWTKKNFSEGTYSFTMDLVRRWIKESHSIPALAEEYRDQVVAQVASFWRQKLAWLADLVLLGLLGLGVLLGSDFLKWGEQSGWAVYFVVAALYLAVSVPSASSTPGLRLAHLRIVDTSARPIHRLRGVVYGLILVARLALLITVLRGAFPPVGTSWFIALGALLILMSVDNLLILFSNKRQGLYDKMMRTLIVPAKAVRE